MTDSRQAPAVVCRDRQLGRLSQVAVDAVQS
jgi:hypothetical protein